MNDSPQRPMFFNPSTWKPTPIPAGAGPGWRELVSWRTPVTKGLDDSQAGKILRRLLRSIANGEAITQDTSTLENPAVLAQLAQLAQKN